MDSAPRGPLHFAKMEYWDEPGDPVKKSFMPGDAWSAKDMKSGAYFVGSLVAPNLPDEATSVETELPYLLSWSKDVEDRYSYSWTNQNGETIQTAVKLGSVWKYTRYEYFPNGKLKKTLTPMDVPGNESQQEFRQVTNYNSEGRVTSAYTKDRGLRKYWYDRVGNLRFSRHEAQTTDEYDFTDYDHLGRPIGSGTQIISGLTQDMADQSSTVSAVKQAQKGYLYDNLDLFASRTGFNLADIIPGKTLGVNGQGRLVCEYNFNRGVDVPFLTAREKFVATFYNYNKYGEVIEAYKYIGPIKDGSRKIHKVTYAYDGRHRLQTTTLTDNQAVPSVLSVHQYDYDALSRVTRINGIGGRFISGYQYFDWGGLKTVTLGGSGAGNQGTRMEYTYNAQGWLKSIMTTRQATSEVVYQQFLGYDDKSMPIANVPNPVQPKFDGNISQQLVKHTYDLNAVGPVRMVDYQYDDMNRMVTANARKNSNATPVQAGNQALLIGDLQWADTEDMDTRMTFDDVGRIQTNQTGVSTAEKASYYYKSDSYKLDRVTGKLSNQSTRDASESGTFEYDSRGRMTADKSKNLRIHYGWDDMPTEFAMDSAGFVVSDLNFYDAGGQRVSRVRARTPVLVPILLDGITFFVKRLVEKADHMAIPVSSIAEVNLIAGGDRRWTEIYTDGLISASSGRSGLSGIGSQVGEIAPNGSYRFFVKNHLGVHCTLRGG